MIVSVQPSKISGSVRAAASKSAMQRACAAALIRKGSTIIHNPGNSNDDKAAVQLIRQLGATVSYEADSISVESNGIHPVSDELNCGESGLSIRMFTPIAALSNTAIIITGEGSLVNRPMNFFDEVLPRMNVQVSSENGKLPLRIHGPLQPKNIAIDGSLSSQFLTGLLMAFAAADAKDITINVRGLTSKPYIDLTLQVMKDFGLKVPVNTNYTEFYFSKERFVHPSSNINYTVEGDWSGAAFLLVAGAIAGNVRVDGLLNTSRQADKRIVDALLDAGADVSVSDNAVEVKRSKLHPFEFDATDCPDLFPPLVALAANCAGVSRLRGVKRLKHKESDRGLTLQEEFTKLGTRIDLDGDEMLVFGNNHLQVTNHVLNSHHDHRIAMACAVASLNADFEVTIRNADAVKKSYPDFWDHLKALNATISLKPFTTDNTFTL
jgi:3-phosphoshikimate 1-carboxyvinyltransferase